MMFNSTFMVWVYAGEFSQIFCVNQIVAFIPPPQWLAS